MKRVLSSAVLLPLVLIVFILGNKYVVDIFIGIVALVVIALSVGMTLLLNKFYFSIKRCRKTLDQLQGDYEYYHALLVGQDNSLIQRLEIISRTNLLYSDIHSEIKQIHIVLHIRWIYRC